MLPGTRDCDYNLQFEEKRCRLELLLKMEVCGGALNVTYDWGAPHMDAVCGEAARSRLALYSVGNHPLECADHGICSAMPYKPYAASLRHTMPRESVRPCCEPCTGQRGDSALPKARCGAAAAARSGYIPDTSGVPGTQRSTRAGTRAAAATAYHITRP